MSYARLRELYDLVHGLDVDARTAVLDAEDVDEDVRAELEALLATGASERDPIASRIEAAAIAAAAQRMPEQIGPYRVLGLIGEGGMGTVLLAERADGAFEMKVAIKLIRGHASGDARERFRRERQVLAGLDHPNIAGLIDGGALPSGEPYLVMPYVEGETLPAWLGRVQPTLETRLSLFVALCRAVAHAHQHLVVHRDLKPSNVLVRRDGVPVLLDFGIAKLVSPKHANDTASRVMTPAYAAPEQLLGRPVTTATDVYGLGLLLYELVAGRVPERGDALEAASAELPPPSKLAADAAIPVVRSAARRVRGDLDKIVRRAVRTEPRARYASALELGADAEAWLAGRPVQAAGTHASYVFSRFVRRHRAASAAVGLALAAAVAFALGLVRERDRARLAEVRATGEAAVATETTRFLTELFSELDPELHPGRALSARELLDLGRDRMAALSSERVRARLQRSLGAIYATAGEPASAIALLESARGAVGDTLPVAERVSAETALARAYYLLKRFDEAYEVARDAVAAAESGDDPRAIGHALLALGVAAQSTTRYDEAEATFTRAQSAFERAGAELELASVVHNRAWLAQARADPETALALYAEAWSRKRTLVGDDHPKTLASLHGRTRALQDLGRSAEAAALLDELVARTIRVHGPETLHVQNALSELGSANQDLGRYAVAQAAYERSLALARKLERDGAGTIEATVLNNLATLLEERGEIAAAETAYRRSRELRRARLPEGHPSRAVPAHNLARMLIVARRFDEASAFAEEAYALRARGLPPGHPQTLATAVLVARVALARDDEAAARAALAPATARAEQATAPPMLRAAVFETQALLAQREGAAVRRIEALRRACEAARGMLAATHPRYAQLELALAEAHSEAGEADEARAILARIAPVLRAELVARAPALDRIDALEDTLAR